MDGLYTIPEVVLNRRGYTISGTLVLSPYHVVFSFSPPSAPASSARTRVTSPVPSKTQPPVDSGIQATGAGQTPSQADNVDQTLPPVPARPSSATGPSSSSNGKHHQIQSDLPKQSSPGSAIPVSVTPASSVPISGNLISVNGPALAPAPETRTRNGTNGNVPAVAAAPPPKEIWICYPVIDTISKSRGSFQLNQTGSEVNFNDDRDHYTSSHIRLQCKDFTYYSFDFANDSICADVYSKLSTLISRPKVENDIRQFYAFNYRPNMLEQKLGVKGWDLYDPVAEYTRQGLISDTEDYWRLSSINLEYKFCPSYPSHLIVPGNISDNVLKHASKFRSKQRIPAIVYKHRGSVNGNVIARCAQPLVGLKLQNRSIQDEKLITEIFTSQETERADKLGEDDDFQNQPHRNLIVDLRPLTNAVAQHALGAGTENIENYRGRSSSASGEKSKSKVNVNFQDQHNLRQVDKIFCNIDNIHVMRDSLNKLTTILNDLDKYPVTTNGKSSYPLLQQSLTKTQWLHRLSIILQSVDRITKSIHLNNTNVVIHCSDGWDRTSQVSALAQLCLDPFYRTLKGFMILIEKEWVSFGFKFATRGDHGGCIGSLSKKPKKAQERDLSENSLEASEGEISIASSTGKVTSFLQRAATHIKNTANNTMGEGEGQFDNNGGSGKFLSLNSTYSGSSEKSPIFHQFLDCVFQIYRQHPSKFEFNSRFLKRLFYHYYSCQYGSFVCDSERELKEVYRVQESTLSVWDYFNSRPGEFTNRLYKTDDSDDNGVLFFNFTDVKWWFELYGRSDEEMNGLSNSLDRKFAQMKLGQEAK